MKKKTGHHAFIVSCFFILLLACKKEAVFIERKPQLTVKGTDKRFAGSSVTLVRDTVYVMAGNINIRRGQRLIIQEGTLLKINNAVKITVEAGGIIEAKGTAANPIVFTSSVSSGAQGQSQNLTNGWDALEIEGEPGFNSGIVSYVRIEFAGGSSSGGSLVLKNVDSTVTIDHIQVSFSLNAPAFVLSGGNCRAKYLYGFCNNSFDFEMSNGYAGKLQFIAAHRHPLVPFQPTTSGSARSLAGIVITGAATFPVISNATVAGPGTQTGVNSNSYYSDTSDTQGKAGVLVSNAASFQLRNISVFGFPQSAFFLNSREGAVGLTSNQASISFSVFHANMSNRVFYLPSALFPGINSVQLKEFLLQPQFSNSVVAQAGDLRITKPYAYDNPDLLPEAGSPLLSGADFNHPAFEDPFFERVNYKGAFGNNNWLNGWANFTPLQTNYNN